MKRKKILALVVVGVLAIGAVGVTYAWFTSKDKVVKTSESYGVEDSSKTNAGVKIQWSGENKFKFLPGYEADAVLNIKNTANYDQYLRVKINKIWKVVETNEKGEETERIVDRYYLTGTGLDEEVHYLKVGEELPKDIEEITYLNAVDNNLQGDSGILLDNDKIELDLNIGLGKDWSELSEEGYYYYNDVLGKNKKKSVTSNLFTKVNIVSGEEDNYYKNLKFDIEVIAEAIQVEPEGKATKSIWSDAPEYLKDNLE